MVSFYALQIGLAKGMKRQFWQGLDGVVHIIPHSERIFICKDFNGHARAEEMGIM